ncbi:MAG TPA: hypothetical protein VFR33_13240 [Candidatus Dormibacteraeota bacterium]|nr:hypothetical protein [Candidatus Dormibacteraeota bacterium]
MKNSRILFALSAPLLAIPFQVLQAAVLLHLGALTVRDWPALLVANVVLLVGICALASDLPLGDRFGRAVLIGVGVPLLIPGPTALDSTIQATYPALSALPNLAVLLALGCAEAGIYLMATRPRPTT